MESQMIFRCKFGADAAVFSLNNGSSLNELCGAICSKFIELSTPDFTVKYVFPGSNLCILLSDEDMGFMFAFIPIVMVEDVDLIVQSTEGSSDLRTSIILNVDSKFSLDIDVDVHSNPSFIAKEVIRNLKREYRISIPYWNAWYTKEMALWEVHGDDDMSYRIFIRYL
ncbi:hypothetical protein LguiB_021317 [Lonicera macranthoides]